MKLKHLLTGGVAIYFMVISCTPSDDPQAIVDRVIENHGGDRYHNVRISFDFRDRYYVLTHRNGTFQYERHFKDAQGSIKDVLNNDGFKRYLNGQDITDTVRRAAAYTRSVNSVAYFALLPYRLNDPAVNKTYLGRVEIHQEPYHKLLITFDRQGGGEDYQDEFIYWMHAENLTMHYLAYLYFTDGGGMRFRAPYNIRTVGGIRFADYENYRETDPEVELKDYDREYEAGSLELLSKIELENLKVEALGGS